MRQTVFIAIGLTMLLISCEKKDGNLNSDTFDASITVYNTEEWSVNSPHPVCSGALIKLITSTETITQVTNDEGKALFEDLKPVIYEIQITKDNLSNLINKDGSGKGFVATGIFQSQEEINTHTDWSGNLLQPNAIPGDIKIDDSNFDNKIDGLDRMSVTYFKPYIDVNADEIISEDDKVIINKEGEMGYRVQENPDMNTYIGE